MRFLPSHRGSFQQFNVMDYFNRNTLATEVDNSLASMHLAGDFEQIKVGRGIPESPRSELDYFTLCLIFTSKCDGRRSWHGIDQNDSSIVCLFTFGYAAVH